MLKEDETKSAFVSMEKELKSPEDIEATVNNFLNSWGKKIIDIKVNTVDVQYHNNARGNTVDLVYTIMYE